MHFDILRHLGSSALWRSHNTSRMQTSYPKVRNHPPNVGMMCGQRDNPAAFPGFTHRNYRYRFPDKKISCHWVGTDEVLRPGLPSIKMFIPSFPNKEDQVLKKCILGRKTSAETKVT